MRLPKELIVVTPFSKFVGLFLFIMLPILAFVLGMHFQSILVQCTQDYTSDIPLVYETEENLILNRQTLDGKFTEVASQIPSFGGMYYDENGQLTFCLKEVQNEEVEYVKQQVKAAFADDPRLSEVGDVNVVPCKYNFMELNEWYSRMNNILSIPGVVMTDIDEVKNRLRIGIENQEIKDEVEDKLIEMGIPLEVVIIEVTGPIKS